MIDTASLQRLVKDNLEELERLRQQQQATANALRRTYLLRAAGGTIVLVLLFTLLSGDNFNGLILGVAGPFIGLLAFIVAITLQAKKMAAPKKHLEQRIKQEIYQKAIAEWYPDLHYEAERFVPEATYKVADLFGAHSRYTGDDYFQGELPNGQSVYFSEIHVEVESTDADSNSSVSTLFKGLFFEVALRKPVATTIKILPDLAERGMGKLGVFLQKRLGKFNHKNSQLVYLEQFPAFEKEFVVYGQDEGLTREWLNTSLVQTIMDLNAAAKGIALRFSDDRLYLAVSHKDDFLGTALNQPLTDPPFIARLVEQLNYVLHLLDFLVQLSDHEPTSNPQRTAIPPVAKKPLKSHPKSPLPSKKGKSKDNPFLL